jgi:hypothetical protein
MGKEKPGYLEPGIRVYQIIEGLTQPLSNVPLNPILVGACYKVATREPLATDGDCSGNLQLLCGMEGLYLPSLPPGAVVRAESVTLRVTGRATLAAAADAAFDLDPDRDDAPRATIAKSIAALLKSGDRIEAPLCDPYTVSYVEGERAYLKKGDGIVRSGTVSGVRIYREYVDHAIGHGDGQFFVESDALKIRTLKAQGVFDFTDGAVSVSYVALRRDLDGRHKIRSFQELLDLMETGIGNPLGFLAEKCIEASGGSALYLHVVSDDGEDAVKAAAEDLSDFGIYYLVPTVGGKGVANAYMSYVQARTRPEMGDFMMALVAPADGVVAQETVASLTA